MASIARAVDTKHCADLFKHREQGQYWERQFCDMAASYGKAFSPHQLKHDGAAVAWLKGKDGRWCPPLTLPDVTIWTAPGEHHEIKHKNPTWTGMFGFEDYRLRALLWFARETGQAVYYTIHNHDLSGGPDMRRNNVAHWVTINVLELDGTWSRTQENGDTYRNGVRGKARRIYYWNATLWQPLEGIWASVE